MKPADDPKADQLVNPNMPQPDEGGDATTQEQIKEGGENQNGEV